MTVGISDSLEEVEVKEVVVGDMSDFFEMDDFVSLQGWKCCCCCADSIFCIVNVPSGRISSTQCILLKDDDFTFQGNIILIEESMLLDDDDDTL